MRSQTTTLRILILSLGIGAVAHGSIGPFGGTVMCVAVDPRNSSNLFVGTYGGGIFRSTDAGAHWAEVNQGAGNSYVFSLAFDQSDSDIIYAGAAGAFKSTDGGQSWTEINAGLPYQNVEGLAVDPFDPRTVYAGTYQSGIFKTVDGGESWSFAGLVNRHVTVLLADPSNPGVVFAATEGAGVYKTIDSGATWSPINNGLTRSWIASLAMDPVDSNVI